MVVCEFESARVCVCVCEVMHEYVCVRVHLSVRRCEFESVRVCVCVCVLTVCMNTYVCVCTFVQLCGGIPSDLRDTRHWARLQGRTWPVLKSHSALAPAKRTRPDTWPSKTPDRETHELSGPVQPSRLNSWAYITGLFFFLLRDKVVCSYGPIQGN